MTNRWIDAVRAGRFVCALALIGSLVARSGLAAPPPNDDFANRIPLTGTRVTVTGSNIDATLEPGEPSENTAYGSPIRKTVWWTWTAPADGGLAVSTLGSDFDAVFSVSTGSSVSNLWPVPGGDSGSPASGRQPAAMRVTAGTAYQFVAGSWSGHSGTVVLDLAFVPRAVNDDFVNRIPLGSEDARTGGSTLGATTEAGEPFVFQSTANGTLWWSWTAATSGPVMFQVAAATPGPGDRLFGRVYDNVSLTIWVGGDLAGLTLVTNSSRGDQTAPPWSRLRWEAVAGTTYQLSVEGQPGFLDQFEFTVARTSPPEVILTKPRNGSEFMVGTPVELAAEAIDSDGRVAGIEFFAHAWTEPLQFRQADATRPFRSVLTNLPPATYSLIARATDDSGIKSDSIPVEFNVRPVNDSFTHRIPFTGAFVTVTGTLANASVEVDEPPAPGQRSIWWAWTAPAAGTYTLTAATDSGNASLGVFTGASLATLVPIPNLVAGSDRAVVAAVAGATYSIAISGFSSIRSCSLHVAQSRPPSIMFTSPTNGMRFMEGSVITLSADATDPDGSVSKVEFFEGLSESLGSVSNAPFTLSRAMAPGDHFVHAVATDDHGVTARSKDVLFEIIPLPPANDAFAQRIPFTGSFITVTGDTAHATLETGEGLAARDGSVWWEWTVPEPGDYSITVASSFGYWPWLAVYTGTEMGSLTLVTNVIFNGRDSSYSALITIHAVAGERYQIAAGSRAVVRIGVARTLPPTVRITNPTNDAVFVPGATVEVRAEATDPDGTISRVEFYLNGGVLFATLTNEPFIVSLPLTYPSYYLFQARAYDNHGVAASSDEVAFLAQEPAPPNDAFADRIRFTGSFQSVTGSTANATREPGEGYWWQMGQIGSAWWEWTAPVSGTFTINADTDGGYSPTLVVFTGTELSGLNLITNGPYRGNASEDSVQVVFEAEAGVAYPISVAAHGPVILFVARTTPPSAAVLQPVANSLFHAGDTVLLQAAASDADGTIRTVEFFLDAEQIGTVTHEPFALQKTFLEANFYHRVWVRATDDRGVSTVSDAVWFEVKNRPPANDNFAARTPLHGWLITLDAVDWETTREPGEPALNQGPGSVWWRWTAPASGRVFLSCDRSYGSLGVCLGTNVAELVVIASNEPTTSLGMQLEFDAIAGVDYAILYQSPGSFGGTFRLSLGLDAHELLGPRMLTPGWFAFDLRTTFDRTWIIEATTNLLDWIPVPAVRGPDGTIEFLDPAASAHPRRFYRAVAQP